MPKRVNIYMTDELYDAIQDAVKSMGFGGVSRLGCRGFKLAIEEKEAKEEVWRSSRQEQSSETETESSTPSQE